MSRLSTNVLRYGREEPLPKRIELRAGPLSLVYEAGGIRHVRLGDREVVRRVYAAVRDSSWATVPSKITDLEVSEQPGSFRVSFDVENVLDDVDFTWRGSIVGEPDGTITFTMDGRARSAFQTARTGLCILHPIAECAGRPCTVEHTGGAVEAGQFPLLISPHQPFMDLRAVTHEVLPGVCAEVRLEGDTFEMEDQRNWTDASYKTYSRPLALPKPYELDAGERVRQTVRIALAGAAQTGGAPPTNLFVGAPTSLEHRQAELVGGTHGTDGRACATLAVSAEALGPLPRIGLGLAERRRPLGEAELARLAALGLAHLRVDLRMSEPAWEATLQRATGEAQAVRARLEVALGLGGAAEDELRALRAALNELRPKVALWLVFARGEPTTSARTLESARRFLADYDPAVPFGGGSAGGFVELNRTRPERGALEVVSYAMNPQVHQVDNTSIVEALDGQAWTIRTAGDFLGEAPLALGPITLRRRARQPEGVHDLPHSVDERQMSLFCAAWTVGSLRRMCEGRVQSATYYETIGWRGVMETEEGSPLPEEFRSLPGAVFPVYHVFADLAEFAGGQALGLTVSHPLLADGLAVRKGERTRVLVANMTDEPRAVTLSGLPGPALLKRLDEVNAERAMLYAENFRADRGRRLEGAQVELPPFAVARVDCEGGA